jgi:catechol 2,3-dioxygenase-like lactoylglutathione lyase family enzyme
MLLDTCHFGIHVHSFDEACEFYVEKLGFEVIQRMPQIKLLAVKVGTVRLSILADRLKPDCEAAAKSGGSIIFRTANLNETIASLRSLDLTVPEVVEAPGFMRFITIHDPSGNLVQIAEYLRDPLQNV